MYITDFLVIGSGIAGLSFAIKTAEKFPLKKITILTKADQEDSNTRFAQGGIATVWDFQNDSNEKHISDTLKTGDGLSNTAIVGMVVNKGQKLLQELINWGMIFDKNTNGELDLALEAGHSYKRVLHHKDATGQEIQRVLQQKIKTFKNIELFCHHFTIDLLVSNKNTCVGAACYNKKENNFFNLFAKKTILASGGIGEVYLHSTNPSIATGDGIAMAKRAGAHIQNMEFVQFHPTALYQQNTRPFFLITEALRGFGALLKNADGQDFMMHYDPRGALAPRDIVSRAIALEIKKSNTAFVYLDCRHLNQKEVSLKFPNIVAKCHEIGIPISRNLIPIIPAAHYACGGIAVNENGQSSLNNLFALGECSYTGMHGANRLASNSLLEALVYAHNCAESINVLDDSQINMQKYPSKRNNISEESITNQDIHRIKKHIQCIMSEHVGIIRTHKGLNIAGKQLKDIEDKLNPNNKNPEDVVAYHELFNLITTSQTIIQQSIQRKLNKGCFYNIDLD